MKTPVKITLGVLVFILAILAIILITIKNRPNTVKPIESTSPATSFTWRYKKGANDLDGFPKTQIVLDVAYQNGKLISKDIDEVQGSCNHVDPSNEDTDKVTGSTKIQCYAAGFGEWYKIVIGDQAYKVMRKNFVEAEPDSTPLHYEYEVVAEIPLVQ